MAAGASRRAAPHEDRIDAGQADRILLRGQHVLGGVRLLNIYVVFTRLFTADAFGDYLLGLAFATFFATLPSSSIKLAIMRQQARGDGTDIRGAAFAALLLSGVTLPIGYSAARLQSICRPPSRSLRSE